MIPEPLPEPDPALPERNRRPIVLLVFLIVFVDLLGFGIILPALPFYSKSFGASPAAFGMLLAVYSLMQFLFNPVWGRVSDRIGRRPVVLLSVAGSAVGFLLFGLAQSLAMLFFARALAGIMNANIATAQSMVADVTPGETRAKSLGLIGAAFGLGFVFGPALGGWMSRWGLAAPAFLAAGLSAANLVLALLWLRETHPRGRRVHARSLGWREWRESVQQPGVRMPILIFFISTFALSVITTTLPFVLLDMLHLDAVRVAEKTGYLFAFVGVVIAITQGGILRPLLKILQEPALILGGAMLMTASLFLLPFSTSVPLLLVSLSLLALGNGVSNPSLTSLISRRTSGASQGSVLGTAQSMSALARILGPIWGGFAYGRWGQQAPYLTGGAIMILAVWMSVSLLRSPVPEGA